LTHELLDGGRVFALSLLPRSQRALVRRFAKPVTDSSVDDATGVGTMEGATVHSATTGAPILDVALSWLDCEVRHVLALGSHSFFVGEVVDCGESSGDEDAQGESDTGVLRMEDTRMNYGG
jgi:flavin reductase (DIM6/NTAB) family NADH-FMN oxidoreductase RutF